MTQKPDSFWRTTCTNSSQWKEFKSLSLVIPISSPCQSWCKRSRDSRSNQVQVIFFFDCVKSWVTKTATEIDSTTVATSVLARDSCWLGVCSLGYDCCHLHCKNKPWFISVDSSPYSLSLVRPYNVYVVLPCLTTLHLLSKLFFPHSSFAFSVYFPAHCLVWTSSPRHRAQSRCACSSPTCSPPTLLYPNLHVSPAPHSFLLQSQEPPARSLAASLPLFLSRCLWAERLAGADTQKRWRMDKTIAGNFPENRNLPTCKNFRSVKCRVRACTEFSSLAKADYLTAMWHWGIADLHAFGPLDAGWIYNL